MIDFQTNTQSWNNLTKETNRNSVFTKLLVRIREINSIHILDDLFEKILNVSIEFLEAERGIIILQEKNGGLRIQRVFCGNKTNSGNALFSQTVIQKVLSNKKALFVPDLMNDETLVSSESIIDMELRSVMCAPLINRPRTHNSQKDSNRTVMGFIYLDSTHITKSKMFHEDNVELLQTLADQAAVALSNCILMEQRDEAEKQLRELNENLEERITIRSRELEQAQKEILDQTYKAGMADIASAVLHNIGNVLTSIVTSSDLIDRIIKHSHIGQLNNANELFRNNLESLEDFIIHNPKGKKLIDYYLLIGDELNKEHSELCLHINRIENKIGFIADIVKDQHEYVGIGQNVDYLNVLEVIYNALKIQATSLQTHAISVHTEFEQGENCTILGHKFKLLYTFISMFKNAEDAMNNVDESKRNLSISCKICDKDVVITLSDTGCGIQKNDTKRIFSQGYSTKNNHRGFSLHNCANYIAEMKGTIHVENDKNTTVFKITIPYHDRVKIKSIPYSSENL